jgi:hypothetical protein
LIIAMSKARQLMVQMATIRRAGIVLALGFAGAASSAWSAGAARPVKCLTPQQAAKLDAHIKAIRERSAEAAAAKRVGNSEAACSKARTAKAEFANVLDLLKKAEKSEPATGSCPSGVTTGLLADFEQQAARWDKQIMPQACKGARSADQKSASGASDHQARGSEGFEHVPSAAIRWISNAAPRRWDERVIAQAGPLKLPGGQASSLVHDIYKGRLHRLATTQHVPNVHIVFTMYVRAFGEMCRSSLSSDVVQLTEQFCTKEQWREDRYGNERAFSRICIKYETRAINVFAERYLDAPLRQLTEQVNREAPKIVLNVLNNIEPIVKYTNLTNEVQKLVPTLIRTNGCESAGLRKLEENLRRYALGQMPV